MDDGLIKYKCNHTYRKLLGYDTKLLIEFRQKLFGLKLIGTDFDGIAYGNISQRAENNKFLITASQTGGLESINHNHITLILKADILGNCIESAGMREPSSEAMTHYAIYLANPAIQSVIHVHNLELWEKHIGKIPSTSINYAYGTPELANEIFEIVRILPQGIPQTIILSGHKSGIIAYANSHNEAFQCLINLQNNF